MDHINEYLALMLQRPQDFADDPALPLVRTGEALEAFERETGKTVGMIFNNAPFYYFIGDVVENGDRRFCYPRILHCSPNSAGGVCLVYAEMPEGRYYYLHRIFRHGPRRCGWEIPRGFRERGDLTAEETIRRELLEEASVTEAAVTRLGACRADSSFIAAQADVFAAEVQIAAPRPTYTEGIVTARWFSREELRKMLGSEVTDAFSLSAFALQGTI